VLGEYDFGTHPALSVLRELALFTITYTSVLRDYCPVDVTDISVLRVSDFGAHPGFSALRVQRVNLITFTHFTDTIIVINSEVSTTSQSSTATASGNVL
jgi:hypothetical protein